jgi:hypothetical protein
MHLSGFLDIKILQGEVVNPQPGGPGYPFSPGSSPLACPEWETLPLATVPRYSAHDSLTNTSPTTKSKLDIIGEGRGKEALFTFPQIEKCTVQIRHLHHRPFDRWAQLRVSSTD